MTPPLLVFGVGNLSRGDDALGPLFLERIEAAWSDAICVGEVELLTEFQLQIEHAMDLVGRQRVVFVDAIIDRNRDKEPPPFTYARLEPLRDAMAVTHALSPAAVLATHRLIAGEPPEAWLMAIRGEDFELGAPLSRAARANLDAALEFFLVQSPRGTSTASAVARSGGSSVPAKLLRGKRVRCRP